jgi:DNA-binding NarL/FixJ family response regulator
MPIRVVLADDHPIVLDGLELVFRAEPDLSVVARCVNGDEALDAIAKLEPDLAILDVSMPPHGALGVMREMQLRKLPAKVVILTASITEGQTLEAVRLGARGIVLKEMAPRLLVDCVREVYAGGQWMERGAVTRALEKVLRREAGGRDATQRLSERELDVVRMVCRGMRNKEIARQLSITEGTVKVHLHSIYEKLEVDGRLALSVYARERSLV